jgi:hypothetical protein
MVLQENDRTRRRDPDIDPNPGTSTGHHLHFAMMNEQMEYVNPNDYLPINK